MHSNAVPLYRIVLFQTIRYPHHTTQDSLSREQRKGCLNGNLTFRLSANDLLRHMQEHVRVDYGNYLIYQNNDRLSQSIKLSVYYRFNASQSKYKGQGAGADAKERIY